ncbi:ABC transporter substrate-binding protein [Chloroflexus islandicus]|uniref:ABC transporter substrate-binding protein n=1 Tax=Chloroflexus islandicus TaxID=1707952 RepID=A0A178M504_9CHLR|nr:hemin ABC transporter substrate-binding protein [Chloroflexus islandicus]OAN43839.1 ABC transporter substrate-binding protein [Chloroflexus islandicus]
MLAKFTKPLVLLIVLALLSACGAHSTANAPTAAPVPTTAPVATAVPDPMTAPEPTTAPAAAEPILPASVTDYQGETVVIESVDRVVSLSGDITEIIFALGMGDSVVGVDISATYPAEKTKALPSIGYQRRLNAEGILSLNPTLVIGNEFAGPPEALAQVQAAGVPLALTANPPTLEAPAQKIIFVARALGIPQRGYALAGQVEAEIARARAEASALPRQPRVLFLYLRGTDVQQVAGANTAIDAMITAAGGINAAAEAGIVNYAPLSPEVVIAAQPDVILVLTKGLESVGGIDGLLSIPGLADTPAGQQRRVIDFDDLYLNGMGPRTGQALADLVAAFRDAVAQTGGS